MPVKTRKIPKLTLEQQQKFWGLVDKTPGFGPNGNCWGWKASKHECGYGYFKIVEHTYKAHRVSYRLAYGAIPVNLYVLHSCDNPSCVNPKHLWIGTAADNTSDMMQKGRHRPPKLYGNKNGHYTKPEKTPRGEHNWNAKLTEKKIFEIRSKHAKGAHTQQKLADAYAVSPSLISRIIRRKAWKHI